MKTQLDPLATCEEVYLATVLNLTNICPKKKCSGLLTEVWVRYRPGMALIKELECTCCGKVIRIDRSAYNFKKPPRRKKEKTKRWKKEKYGSHQR